MNPHKPIIHLTSRDETDRLSGFFTYVYDEIEFYRNRFKSAGLSRGEDPFRLLDKLPILDSSAYVDLQLELLLRLARSQFLTDYTSGTTGKRKIRVTTKRDEDAEAVVCEEFFRRFGIGPSDRVLALDIDSSQIYLFYGKVMKHLGVRYFSFAHIFPGNDDVIEAMVSYQPTCILTVPSLLTPSLRSLQTAMTKNRLSTLKKFIFIGEPTPVQLRYFLGSELHCKSFSLYGSTEIGSVAAECEFNQGVHIDVKSVVPTILVDKHIDETVSGQILWTTLHFKDQPLVKYSTNDYVSVSLAKCKCGDDSPRILSVRRTHDEIVLYGYKMPYDAFRSQIANMLMPDHFFQVDISGSTVPMIKFLLPHELECFKPLLYESLSSVDDMPYFLDRQLVYCQMCFVDDPIRLGRKVPNIIDRRRTKNG